MELKIRNASNPIDAKHYLTERLREEFLVSDLFVQGKISMIYSHIDRLIIGGVYATSRSLLLEAGETLGTDYFLSGREIGIVNIGSQGKVKADGDEYSLNNKEVLYIGKGTKSIEFYSVDNTAPALFYFNSVPAHKEYPTLIITQDMAKKVKLGSLEESNLRTIFQFIHPEVMQSCQLLMGVTVLEPNNLWNTMHCHTHDRRMEAYLYFDLPDDAVVFHFMGEPHETRHIIVRNREAVISPSWSIHSGAGTSNYSFVWGMAGENQTFTDMDVVEMKILK